MPGNRKGIPNKNKIFLLKRLQDMYGDDFHPIMKAAEQASKMDDVASKSKDIDDRKKSVDAWMKIAEYTEPKLKAMEVDVTTGGEPLPARIELVAKSAKKDG